MSVCRDGELPEVLYFFVAEGPCESRTQGFGSRPHVDTGAGGESCKELAVYNYWTGLVDWTGTLEWWTDIKNHFYAFLETHSPVGLHDV